MDIDAHFILLEKISFIYLTFLKIIRQFLANYQKFMPTFRKMSFDSIVYICYNYEFKISKL